MMPDVESTPPRFLQAPGLARPLALASLILSNSTCLVKVHLRGPSFLQGPHALCPQPGFLTPASLSDHGSPPALLQLLLVIFL